MGFDTEFKPILRFMVISDIHLNDTPSVEDERLEKAISTAYALSDGDARYNNLDALVVVGDFATSGTEIQMQKFKSITDRLVRAGTQQIMTMASHEYKGEGGEAGAIERFDRIFALPKDSHTVINGYHFIGITCTNGCHFDEKKREFAARELKKAAKEGGKNPIFFFQHPHIMGTVYGSIAWGEDELNDILVNYPQIIDFSGHSHAPINDPRSIHQRHFTCLGTGSMRYIELDEFAMAHGTVPPQSTEVAQMLIVEADEAGRVRAYPYDLISGSFFPYTWKIDSAWDPASFTYTDARYKTEVRPYFEDSAEISVEKSGEDSITVTFTQAKTDEDYVDTYDIQVVSKSDGLIKRQANITSRYYLYNMPEVLSRDIDGIDSGEYTLRIYANSFWNTKSEPISAEFKI